MHRETSFPVSLTLGRRGNYWIQPEFQKRFILRILGLVTLATALTAAVTLGFVYWQDQAMKDRLFLITEQMGSDPMVMARWKILLPILIVSEMLIVVIAGIFSVLYSHHLAGPIYKICKTLETSAQGRSVEAINLRKGDEFKELADAINRFMVTRKS
ncbi:MAG: hypothetical protein HY400_00070 [Elusimicrobia bacterium]|nr:hypothetical protein [Elusimicrobiota bacterium]